jgi:exosortase D (VPLPA-CTERM-specific)
MFNAGVDKQTNVAGGVSASARVLGPGLFILSFAAACLFFANGFSALVRAWATPEYSHGPIIPFVSVFLFLREMRGVPPVSIELKDRWPGVAVVMLGLLIGLGGNLAQVHQVVIYGFMVWIVGMVLVCFGFRRGVQFWPALLHLVFMLPLPTIIYWQVSVFLQGVSSVIGVAIISLLGIPVYLDGNIIDLGIYKLQVAEACSGLRYLFPMLSFTYTFAVLYQGPIWHKVLLLLLAAPITIAMNSFRIGVIGVLVNYFGIEHAEGFLHTFEGWIIFVACVAILFGVAIVLQRLRGSERRALSETIDIEFEGLGREAARVAAVVPSRAIIAAAIVTVTAAVSWHAAPQQEARVMPRDPFVLFPTEVEGWLGRVHPQLDPAIEQVLAADDYFSAAYSSGAERAPVDLFMAYYHDQNDGTGIHSPEVCIPAGGWEVTAWDPVSFTLDNGATVDANRAVISRGAARQLVYFWFELRGRRISGDYEAKALNLFDSAVHGRSDGALIRLITPIAENEASDAADRRLVDFANAIEPSLPHFIPR